MSLKSKITITFLAGTLIPLLFVSAVMFNNYKNSLEAARLSELRHIAAVKAERIEAYFAELKLFVEFGQNVYAVKDSLPVLNRLAKDPANPEFIAAKEALDNIFQNPQKALKLSDIMLVNPERQVVYASDPGHSRAEFPKPLSEFEEKAVTEGRGKAYFSDIFLKKTEGQGGLPEMLITAPIHDFNGTLMGIIVAEVDLRPIYRLIQETAGMGRTGEVLVGKKAGSHAVFLSPLRHDPKEALGRRVSIGEKIAVGIQEAVQGRIGSGQIVDYRGKRVIAAWRYLPSIDWGMVAKIDSDEAFGDISDFGRLVAVILIIVFILSGVTAFSIARSITRPLEKLSKDAEIIGSGRLDHKVGTDLKDEVGQLSRAFDKMTEDLRNSIALRNAERQRLYDVLETLPVYVVLLDKDYRVPFANKFFRERFGESHGRRCYEYLFNRTAECENCQTYKVMKTGSPHNWEWDGPDGCIYDIHDFPFKDVDGSTMILEMGIDVTLMKKAEKALKDYQMHLETLVRERTSELNVILDSVPAMIFYKDKENRLLRVNKAFENAMGLSKKQLEGKSLFDIYTKEQADAYWRDDLEVIKSAKPKHGIIETLETPQGVRIVQTDKIPYLDERGNVSGIIGFAADITERKRAEDGLRESQKDLERAQAVGNTGNWRLDIQRNELVWSDENYRIFGIPKGTPLTYETFLSAVHPDDRDYVDSRWKASMAGEDYDIEHRIIVDGKVKWVREKAFLELSKDGALLAGFGITQDITARKMAEAKIFQAKEEWERTFDSVPDMIAILDDKHRIVRANKAMAKALNVTPEECAGLSCFECVHGLSGPPDFCPHVRTLRDGREHIAEVHEEKLGGDFLVSTTPIFDGEGRMTGAVHVARDITLRKKAEEVLRRDKDTLERIVEEKSKELISAQMELERAKRLSDIGTLAATVAHELRNPLAAMNMAAANIRRKANNPNLERHLNNIEKKIAESDQIINNLLFYSRLRAPNYENIDLYGILEECAEMTSRQFKKKLVLRKEMGSVKDILVEADPVQLKEVFYNLLNNAHDAVQESGGEIEMRADNGGKSIKLYFSDNGSGIDKRHIDRIFEPFFTTKAKGTGLGLTVCRQIVDMHGGAIDVESEPQKGTTVAVTLPVRRAAPLREAGQGSTA